MDTFLDFIRGPESKVLVMAIFALIFAFCAAYAYRYRHGEEKKEQVRQKAFLPDVLKVLADRHWHWNQNRRCRNVTLIVDTRSSHLLTEIYDRYGERITLEELKAQRNEQGYE